jgi:hypothetical protein
MPLFLFFPARCEPEQKLPYGDFSGYVVPVPADSGAGFPESATKKAEVTPAERSSALIYLS